MLVVSKDQLYCIGIQLPKHCFIKEKKEMSYTREIPEIVDKRNSGEKEFLFIQKILRNQQEFENTLLVYKLKNALSEIGNMKMVLSGAPV